MNRMITCRKWWVVGLLFSCLGFSLFIDSLAYASDDIDRSRETAITRAIARVGPSVASINVVQIKEYYRAPFFDDPFFQFLFPEGPFRQRIKSLGSGVVISPDGYVITNQHVIEAADEIIVTLPGGKQYDAEIVGQDRTTDMAVLKIDGKRLQYAQLGNSDELLMGEWVIALGNPFGLFDVNKQPTATLGIISSVDLDFGREFSGRIYQEMIQTDAAINQGNSGGPLCDSNGEVIGINTFIFTGGTYSEGSIGIGFAIPINRARDIAEELKRYGKIDRSFTTGLLVQPVNRSLARYLRLPRVGGVIITEVEPGSTAENAGLQVGDVISEVNGQPVDSKGDVLRIIEENYLRAGDRIEIRYYRDGKERKASLRLSKT
ncbi:MAG: trypsin-like peptidase domain-containing protein [Candidatus Neomarinimicrobiota bacterium]